MRHSIGEIWARLNQGEIIYDPDKDFSEVKWMLVKIKSNSVVWVIIFAFKVFLKKPIGENLWFVEKALDKSVYFCIFFSSPELKVVWIKIDLWWYWTVFKIKSPKKKIRRKTKARIRCDEELGILCWPVTPAVWSLLYSGINGKVCR